MSSDLNTKILHEISKKLDTLILLTTLQGKTEKEKIKILKSMSKSGVSKRELEKATGIDRHKF